MAKQAIDAPRLNAFLIEPERLTIVLDDAHPLYDERVNLPISEELVLSIMAHGVLQPVLITKNGETLEVVDGRQRVRAALVANERLAKAGKDQIRIPVLPKKGDDSDLFGTSITVNELRQSDSIMTKARKAKRLLDMGKTEDEVAIRFGVSSAAIRQWLKLFDLAPQVRKAVEEGAISASAAAKLAPLKKAEQVEKLADLRGDAPAGKKVSTKKVAAAAKRAQGKAVVERPSYKLIKQLTEFGAESATEGVTEEDCKILRWVLGEIDAKEAGLATILQAMEEAAVEKDDAKNGAATAATG